ncbi:hypothetical protein GCM10009530_63130 [Microbispora corallina]|uniref:Uncharacterized protein n=1 Tax=Microbispora corallina TaxID=83302 RepID=A0ABQ4GBL8_9ACTN|nr:hypothetical protein [Microbispora corallina]GIH44457.1 hypothetical protein Mco01_74570 [Microbispora corallina]
MNALAETYIADKLVAYRIKLCGAWTLGCIERAVQDEFDTPTNS